ncbi:MAG: DUF4304 domain-containing protein [Sulfuritalea sp.]|jgi:hypothetical protein|nr:DUF4304 domain-containing protein [Sulfuritalea sp.]
MDSKVVSRGIRAGIWSVLKEHGFSHFTTRTAWRYHPDRIDVINFQSFNSYNASVIGCSTFSFAVNLGCFLLYVPYEYGITNVKDKGGLLLPDEAQCQLRGRIKPNDHRSLFERMVKKGAPKDIWLIRENGSNVESVLTEVRDALLDKGLKWFLRFEQREDVLRILTSAPEEMGELWGFGNNPSPKRSYCVGYTALALGHYDLALPHLQSVLSSGCFKLVESQLRTAVDAAAQPIIPPDAAR